MNVSPESYGHAVILNLQDEITEDSLSVLQRAVDHQLEAEEVIDLLLNLQDVPFLDSAALEYLLDLQDRLSDRLGQVKLIAPDENVRKILEITRLGSVFETFDNVAQAMKAVHV